ncbi:hypothetical protein C7212DRAFT_361986 [Tuber magnatum]|uniref:Uncharacterized protein n=1 Tax=Tuber magnatum TaxID=42249 RepID=A0A317T027_9PEZI|nr:hypothetical protein C7212DRAFT_361986 [Tuber magnatum]
MSTLHSTTTPPKPEMDRARVALPPSLSIKDYLHLLRTHTSPSSRRHLDTSAFWHDQATEHAARVDYLQTKLREAESSLSSASFPSQVYTEQDWEAFRDEGGEGEGALELVSALRILKSSVGPVEVAAAVKTVGGALRGVVSSLVKGREKPAPPARRRRGGRWGGRVQKGKGKKSGGGDGKRDESDVISAIESTLEKVVSALQELGDGLGEDEGEDSGRKEYTAAAACAVIETLTGLVNSIYTNSQVLSSAACAARSSGEGVPVAKDLRLGICKAIIQTLSSLDSGMPTEASVMEGVMCHLLEGAGTILSLNGRESRAVKETSWYLVKMLKEILPLYDNLGQSGLGKRKRDELRRVFMSGVFGTGLGLAGQEGRAGQNEDRMDGVLASPYTKAIWGLMGWSVFSTGELNSG